MPDRSELNGLGVLVTRPAHQAGPLCDLITDAGGRPVRFPLLRILDNGDTPEVTERLMRLRDYDLAIFISPNAVYYGLAAIGRHGGLPHGLKLAVVGGGSARELKQHLGRKPDLAPSHRYDSEGLLALPGLQAVQGKRILILRGNGGRELLGTTLRARGARVDYAEVYRREAPEADAAEEDWLDKSAILTVTSGEAVQNLVAATPEAQRGTLFAKPLIVVSERTAALARELGFTRAVRVSQTASDEAIMEAVIAMAAEISSAEGKP